MEWYIRLTTVIFNPLTGHEDVELTLSTLKHVLNQTLPSHNSLTVPLTRQLDCFLKGIVESTLKHVLNQTLPSHNSLTVPLTRQLTLKHVLNQTLPSHNSLTVPLTRQLDCFLIGIVEPILNSP